MGQWCYANSQKEAQEIFDNGEGYYTKVPYYDQNTKRKAIESINALMDSDETVGREIDRLSKELDKIHNRTMTDVALSKWASKKNLTIC